jgi:hypothetical protein
MNADGNSLALIRRLLLAATLVGMLGTLTELFLLEHYEDGWQYVPLIALTLGALLTLLVLLRPSGTSVRMLRLLLLAFVVVGLLGIWRHYAGNADFELERHPELQGLALLWAVLRGATPALAPGTMVQLALFGLIALHAHPATATRRNARSD